ncbi:MAG: hypothetical protein ABJO86_05630 [Lentilitoribacter sp.]
MGYTDKTKQHLAAWIVTANLIAITAVLTTFSTHFASAHEDDVRQHVLASTTTKMVGDHLMLDLNLANFSGKTISVQSLSINGVALRSIDQSLSDQASMEVSGSRAIQLPLEYSSSMFLALELDLGRDGTMTIPVVVSN